MNSENNIDPDDSVRFQKPLPSANAKKTKQIKKMKTGSTEGQIKAEIEVAFHSLNQRYLNKNFDTVSEIVDMLLSNDSTVNILLSNLQIGLILSIE